MRAALDILFVADPRFEGGTSTALAAEIKAASQAGLRTGLLMVKGPVLGLTQPVHPDVDALVKAGATAIMDPDCPIAADLVLIHHPTIFLNLPLRRLTVAARTVVLILHHPRVSSTNKVQYPLDRVVDHCASVFGTDILLAPVSRVVRDSVAGVVPARATLLPEDWHNLLDVDAWSPRPERPVAYPVVIGRHSRPDPLKWPDERDEALLAYPSDAARYRVRVLGGGPYLNAIYGNLPANWDLQPFDFGRVNEFLQGLDFYVYFHSSRWSEAFGRTILEALATGLVVILPEAFKPIFNIAAVYCEPKDVQDLISRFVADPKAYREQAELARNFARRHFGADQFAARLRRLFDTVLPDLRAGSRARRPSGGSAEPEARRCSGRTTLPTCAVLFVSTNGIGLGHLTQQLALARRLPETIVPVFATMSMAMIMARNEGYETHFLTYHKHIDAEPDRWNRVLAEELFDLIAFTRPRVLVYDGTMPFTGLIQAMRSFPNVQTVWVRRPMWREHHKVALLASGNFDAIVEPGELAEAFDLGPTQAERSRVYVVPPVLHIDPGERLDRARARAELGVSDGDVAVALQLGSGANFELERLRRLLIEALLRHGNVVVLDIRSPIRSHFDPEVPLHPRHRIVELFPSFRLSAGFDLAVSAAGYNSFHENVIGAVPTVFVPNEAEEMDLQVHRAQYAEVKGLGRILRRDHDLYAINDVIDGTLAPETRAAIQRNCRALQWSNGADRIADFIGYLARFVRTDEPILRLQ